MQYKLGSLFDGSGGFPLAGALCGITPTWASEVEPYPIAVTRTRFPDMVHLGDISKVNGAHIEPVDIITFGSPCQDLSVAGKRAGLKHEANGDEETTRSGLFMEAVRIIKEMREATNGEYPRFALWENVPGAFSSNSGNDFRVVCEELIKIVEPRAVMPAVPAKGWNYADSYSGDGWSLAYRVFDAQYWGVPQRRRRIHLVVDFRGECAREILFEREGVRGYFAQGRAPWQSIASHAQDCTGADDREGEGNGGRQLDAVNVPYTLKIRGGVEVDSGGKAAGKGALIQKNLSATLGTSQDQYLFQPTVYSFDSLASNSMKSSNPHSGCRAVETAKTLDISTPDPSKNQGGIAIVEPVVFDGANVTSPTNASNPQAGDPCHTLSTDSRNLLVQPVALIDSIGGQAERGWEGDTAPTLKATHYKSPPCVTVPAAGFCTEHSEHSRGIGYQEETAPTLRAGVVPATVYDARGNGDGDTVPTLTGDHGNRVTDYTAVAVEPVYCLQGNGIDRADTAGCNGKGYREGEAYTLNTIARPAVAFQTYQKVTGPLMANSHPGSYTGQDAFSDMLVAGEENPVHYIVRRLTPTECARLQGFADRWGDIDQKTDLTDEELAFWLEVRNTHAAINGKVVKDYTKAQMLTWYSKLHTDSAEYKMWGNGISLPPALYCMQGIVDVLDRGEEDDSWML